jgi:Mycothiol maleylpyruvate isomerase N-terminal domain
MPQVVPERICETVVVQLEPGDVGTAAEWVVGICLGVPGLQWNASRRGIWAPRRTLDHLVDAVLLYSAYIATRAQDRITPPRNGDLDATPDALLSALRSGATILESLLLAMPDGTRAFHPSGRADRTGWIGMACTELLVHGYDIAVATGLRVDSRPDTDELASAVVERVLPWTSPEGNGWERLLWATGRAPLGPLSAQDSDWWWHSAPLEEWDGQPRRRSAPPQW